VSDEELSAPLIRELLETLGQRLSAKGVEANIYVVGGSAIALEFDARRTTSDVDARFEPRTTVLEEAAILAEEYGLRSNWLNDASKAYIPDGVDSEASRLPGVNFTVASPRYLLAMKMAAGRERDVEDIAAIMGHLGITDPYEAADITLALYGEDSMQVSGSREDLSFLAAEALTHLKGGASAPPAAARHAHGAGRLQGPSGSASSGEAKCSVCNRPLTSDESRARGTGPTCGKA
jgi:predicted nucleotidyltransferase